MDCFGTYLTHAQSCDNVRVHSATQWTASVHTLRMPKAVITFMFKVLQDCFGTSSRVLKLINRVRWCKGSPRVTGHIAWPGRPRVRIAAFKCHTLIYCHFYWSFWGDVYLAWCGIYFLLDCHHMVLGESVWRWLQSLTLVDLLQLICWCTTILSSRLTVLRPTPGYPRYLVFHQQLPDLLRAELLNPDRRQEGIRGREVARGRSRSHSI